MSERERERERERETDLRQPHPGSRLSNLGDHHLGGQAG